jgi:hypothetical protein
MTVLGGGDDFQTLVAQFVAEMNSIGTGEGTPTPLGLMVEAKLRRSRTRGATSAPSW